MGQFIAGMGMFFYPMILLVIAIVILAVKKIADLWLRKDLPPERLVKGLHAILFWGSVTALFGILGQLTGIYNALSVIMQAKEISPGIVAQGFAESFTTTIFGLEVLLISSIVWFVLYSRYRKLASS